MTDPSMYTAAQAAHPGTPPAVLAQIVQDRPDLRAAVAGNPAAYPALVEWLGALGDPAVDAAIASRSAVQSPPPPAAQPAPPASQPAPPAAQPAPPASQPAPQVIQPPGAVYAPAPTYAPVGPASGKKGLGAGAIIGIVVGALVLVGGLVVGGFFLVQSVFGTSEPQGYGDDAALDELWDECAAGDMAACDLLWQTAPSGSEYETFGDTCGGLQDEGSGVMCAAAGGSSAANTYGDDATLDASWDACAQGDMQACDELYFASGFDTDYEAFADICGGAAESGSGGSCASLGGGDPAAGGYGDDPQFDALWDACAAGDMAACDDLYALSPIGSEYEAFGDTCGGTQAPGSGSFCTADTGSNGSTAAFTYGDDSAMDALWDACEQGDMGACDELYMLAPIGSEYETYGDTCGYRQEQGTSFCEE